MWNCVHEPKYRQVCISIWGTSTNRIAIYKKRFRKFHFTFRNIQNFWNRMSSHWDLCSRRFEVFREKTSTLTHWFVNIKRPKIDIKKNRFRRIHLTFRNIQNFWNRTSSHWDLWTRRFGFFWQNKNQIIENSLEPFNARIPEVRAQNNLDFRSHFLNRRTPYFDLCS